MEQVSNAITTTIGVLLIGAIVFEISRRRRKLRELYNVLEREDRQLVADLESLVGSGALAPFVGEAASGL